MASTSAATAASYSAMTSAAATTTTAVETEAQATARKIASAFETIKNVNATLAQKEQAIKDLPSMALRDTATNKTALMLVAPLRNDSLVECCFDQGASLIETDARGLSEYDYVDASFEKSGLANMLILKMVYNEKNASKVEALFAFFALNGRKDDAEYVRATANKYYDGMKIARQKRPKWTTPGWMPR